MPETILSLENANIYQGKTPVLHDVNLKIEKGEFVYLIGKTGSGKSSLLKTLYGELPLKEGEGRVAGFDLRQMDLKKIPFLRRKMGIVFQDFKLLTDRNVYDNLDFVLRATGWDDAPKRKARIEEVLEMVHLPAKSYKKTYEMSGGEQQRVDIARALLNSPELILADEPTGNLDPETTDVIMELLLTISAETQASVLMATHDYSILQKYPNRIVRVEANTVQEHQML
ncbi:MAG: ATP-binding cassette domain-containing protein [Sphingobacteriales bacterium]|nr:MAG: ATP-binding cassette domain-containing protein [Sphingobacteriales bacterium]